MQPQRLTQPATPAFNWDLNQSGDLLIRLSKETSLAGLMDLILTEARILTGAEGGTFYRIHGDDKDACLSFAAIHNSKLGIHISDASKDANDWHDLPLFINLKPNYTNVATFVALSKEAVIIDDAYETHQFDFSGTREFDHAHHYRSRSMMAIPLLNYDNHVIGVLQLINARSESNKRHGFSHRDKETVEAMAKFAAITLDNHLLVQGHKNLLDSFIKALAKIIDVRSPHTSAHCQRIPVLTKLIATAACQQKTGYFEHFNLNDDEWYELNVAAWLHDCGKLATSENVLNKGTKLERLHDGMPAVRARFASLATKDLPEMERKTLLDDLAFLEHINQGGEFMSEEHKARVHHIAHRQWTDLQGQLQPMLTDYEVTNLCIDRGTINKEERAHINRHIDVTIAVLDNLPFPPKLKRVPEYAGGHHERMDGKGYPKGLTRDQMSIPARIMGIADVFEALTAKERPYKPPMPLSQAFSILKRMKEDGHIDPDIFELFLTSGVWQAYAKEHMLEQQIDVSDVTPFLR